MIPTFVISPGYELEFRIENMELIECILKKPNLKCVGFEDYIVSTVQPVIQCSSATYRHNHCMNNTMNSDTYERKELIYRNIITMPAMIVDNFLKPTPNPLVYTYDNKHEVMTDVVVKYSLETPVSSMSCHHSYNMYESQFENGTRALKPENIYRKLRHSYQVEGLPFRIDLTCRYFPIRADVADELYYLQFTSDQVLQFPQIDGFKLVVDMEFEYVVNELDPDCNWSANEFNKLQCFMSNYDQLTYSAICSCVGFDFTHTPQVDIITNTQLIDPSLENKWVWSDKMDGVRYLVIILDNKLYTYNSIDRFTYYCTLSGTCQSLYILDCELLDGMFYVFDVYVHEYDDVRSKPYLERLSLAGQLGVSIIQPLPTNTISSYDDLIAYALTPRPHTDGVVLHLMKPINTKTWPREKIAFKLKPVAMNTIDFMYKYIPSLKWYQLYLTTDYPTFTHALRDRSICDRASQDMFNYDPTISKTCMILFDVPYYENMWKYIPTSDDIQALTNSSTPDALDGMIVESQYVNNRWKPIRVRTDKQYPNSYHVGLTNVGLMFDPPHTMTSRDVDEIEPKLHTYIWDYITNTKSKYLPFTTDPITLLDFEANEFDIPCYQYANVRKVFIVHDNATQLVNCVNRVLQRATTSHILPTIHREVSNRLCINVCKTECYPNDLLRCDDFKIREVNMIQISSTHSLALIDKIRHVLSPDCVILYIHTGSDQSDFITFYDTHINQIIHHFNPMAQDDFVRYLYGMGMTKNEISLYENVNCVLMSV